MREPHEKRQAEGEGRSESMRGRRKEDPAVGTEQREPMATSEQAVPSNKGTRRRGEGERNTQEHAIQVHELS